MVSDFTTALNSVANYQILQRCALEDIFIFPAAADNGIAAGCALCAYAEREQGTCRPPLTVATLGRGPSPSQVDAAIDAHDGTQVTALDGIAFTPSQPLECQ